MALRRLYRLFFHGKLLRLFKKPDFFLTVFPSFVCLMHFFISCYLFALFFSYFSVGRTLMKKITKNQYMMHLFIKKIFSVFHRITFFGQFLFCPLIIPSVSLLCSLKFSFFNFFFIFLLFFSQVGTMFALSIWQIQKQQVFHICQCISLSLFIFIKKERKNLWH